MRIERPWGHTRSLIKSLDDSRKKLYKHPHRVFRALALKETIRLMGELDAALHGRPIK